MGTKLAGALGHPVAFETDGYDLESGTAWSVVVKGRAVESTRLHEVLDAMKLPIFPWHDSPKPHYVRIEPDTVTGRRFTVAGGARTGSPGVGPEAAGGSEDSAAQEPAT